jgi:hypothetical protein
VSSNLVVSLENRHPRVCTCTCTCTCACTSTCTCSCSCTCTHRPRHPHGRCGRTALAARAGRAIGRTAAARYARAALPPAGAVGDATWLPRAGAACTCTACAPPSALHVHRHAHTACAYARHVHVHTHGMCIRTACACAYACARHVHPCIPWARHVHCSMYSQHGSLHGAWQAGCQPTEDAPACAGAPPTSIGDTPQDCYLYLQPALHPSAGPGLHRGVPPFSVLVCGLTDGMVSGAHRSSTHTAGNIAHTRLAAAAAGGGRGP